MGWGGGEEEEKKAHTKSPNACKTCKMEAKFNVSLLFFLLFFFSLFERQAAENKLI